MEAFPLRDFWEHIIIVNTWANPHDESFQDYMNEQHETFLEKILQCENLKKIMESKKIDVPHSLKEYFVCSKKKSKYPEISKIFDEIKIDIKSKKFMFKDIQIGPIIKDTIKSKKNAGFYRIKEYRIITCVDFDNNKSTIEQIIHQDEIPPENFKLVRVNREEVFEDSDDVKWYDVATLGIARIIRKTKRYKVFKTKVYKIGDKEIIGDRLEDGYIYK